jgi:hypothetical protein
MSTTGFNLSDDVVDKWSYDISEAAFKAYVFLEKNKMRIMIYHINCFLAHFRTLWDKILNC